jgi:hypothetical protein
MTAEQSAITPIRRPSSAMRCQIYITERDGGTKAMIHEVLAASKEAKSRNVPPRIAWSADARRCVELADRIVANHQSIVS